MTRSERRRRVHRLERAVLDNDIEAVEEVFEKYGRANFTSRAVGIAMRYCDVNMVDTLLDYGATLAYGPLPVYLQDAEEVCEDRFSASIVGKRRRVVSMRPDAQIPQDYAKYLFPLARIDEEYPFEPVPESERLAIIRSLVERRLPSLPNFLYFAAIFDDIPVYDYLVSNGVERLQEPYLSVVSSELTQDPGCAPELLAAFAEFKDALEVYDDAVLAGVLNRLAMCISPKKVQISRGFLDIQRVCSPELFSVIAMNCRVHEFTPWELLVALTETGNAAGLDYALRHGWHQSIHDLERLLDIAHARQQPMAEVISTLLTAKRKDGASQSDQTGLFLDTHETARKC